MPTDDAPPPDRWNVWALLILAAVVVTVLGMFYQLFGDMLGGDPIEVP
ncbi:MAG: hypothetical protein L0027_08680 [Candidatus Rokubacteria bacterium]|nr:hypothetical protein [Candidatus Rokubacteria bacterium]